MHRNKLTLLTIIVFSAFLFTQCGKESPKGEMEEMEQKLSQFAEVELKYDESLLDERQKVVVEKLHEAAQIMDEIFLDQVYSKNYEIREDLQTSSSELDKQKLKYFNIMFGPFDRLDHNAPFVGSHTKPEGANFYPEDMTREEFNTFIKENPHLENEFTSEFTVIRRDENDGLKAIPYSEHYASQLSKAAALLREAADFADNGTLKNYLLTRADAFESNDYFESDMAWMDLKDHTIEVIIGPYEVYEDELFGYKAALECFLTLVDPEESEKLSVFAGYLNDMERHLPIPDEHKNFDRGSESPIMVVQEVYSAGDTKAGVQTLAFNLPNDEKVREAKGSKKVMLKNLHEAKFEKLLKPIAKIVLDPDQLEYVTFDGFFNHTLMHEMTHGIGPGKITVDGRETEVRKELKETYSIIEECKADILGMYNNIFMIEKGVYPKEFEQEIWVTFLAGTFRSVRFGINEAHGGGNAIIYNYLLEKGGYEYDEAAETVRINNDKIYGALKELANKLLMIQATGDYEGAKNLIANYGIESESMKTLVGNLSDLPVDIKPVFHIDK